MSTAVELNNVNLIYGRGKSKLRALRNVTSRMPTGSIYGLLGPSGSGKTSLLACCLGIERPCSGTVTVFGHPPGTRGLGVPGHRVGYMPQSYTLHVYFTTKEILWYYARIFGMDSEHTSLRTTVLLELLDLHRNRVADRPIGTLSGGQRRRVSLACAMIHNPRLLILDEPTVGVDPLLREAIWYKLKAMTESEGTTVLITTHYMEEAARANKVGFLRQGQILAEDTPDAMLRIYERKSLEDVFSFLCTQDECKSENDKVIKGFLNEESIIKEQEAEPLLTSSKPDSILDGSDTKDRWKVFQALLFKNLSVLRRHKLYMGFNAVLPLVTFLIFIGCIGQPIRDLRLAVVNLESECQPETIKPIHCPQLDVTSLAQMGPLLGNQLSCHILDLVDPFVIRTVSFRPTIEVGRQSVLSGEDHGLLVIQRNFSEAFTQRLQKAMVLNNLTKTDVISSQFAVNLDMTNQEVSRVLRQEIIRSIQKFFSNLTNRCDLPPFSTGLNFDTVYRSVTLSQSMLPSMMVLTLFLFSMALTADQVVTEKEAGLLTRERVCGVSLVPSMISQTIVQTIVVFAQSLLCIIVLGILFRDLGGVIIVFMLVFFLVQCFAGMTCGFLISSLCHTREQVIQLGLSFVFPCFLLAGIIWPRIAMPSVLQYLSIVLPLTLPCDAAKEIIMKRAFDPFMCGAGILVPLVWGTGFFVVSFLIIRRWGLKL